MRGYKTLNALRRGETIDLGGKTVRWLDTPHVPHGWDCGLLMDLTANTFFCGDLFTQTAIWSRYAALLSIKLP